MKKGRIKLAIVGPSDSPLLRSVGRRLVQGGILVDFFLPGEWPEDLSHYRLVVLRAKDPVTLDWAKHHVHSGVRFTPLPSAVINIKDRWACRQMMMHHGIGVPDAVIVTPEEPPYGEITRLLPVVLKRRRSHGHPVQLVKTAEQLRERLKNFGANVELIAEQYVFGSHFTAYFIGDRTFVFAKREWLGDEFEDTSALAAPEPSFLESVMKYRKATGVGFGKVDLVASASGVLCVDGGVFPKFRHVPSADVLLAEHFASLL